MLEGLLREGLNAYSEIEGAKAGAEAAKWNYLSTIPQTPPTGDPNAYREAEPVKGQQNDGSTIVGVPYRTYGGLPVWGWASIAFMVMLVLAVALSGKGRR